VPWAAVGPDGERRLLEDGISVRCLAREDGEPVDDPEDGISVRCLAREDGEPVDNPDTDGVEAIVARAY